MPKFAQPSFNKGEVTPEISGRFDIQAYRAGLWRALNATVSAVGGIKKRYGTKYVDDISTPNEKVRLIPFIAQDNDEYILVFGDRYIEFIRNDLFVNDGGRYRVTTPYLLSEIFDIRYSQLVDVMTLVHPNHPPKELKRFSDTNWTLTDIDFLPSVPVPEGLTAVNDSGGSGVRRYKVTAVDSVTGEESLSAITLEFKDISSVSRNDPAIVVVDSSAGYYENQEIEIRGTGYDLLDNRRFRINDLDAGGTSFKLLDSNGELVDTSALPVYGGGGRVYKTEIEIDHYATNHEDVIQWDLSSTSVSSYVIYRNDNGVFSWIGESETNEFKDGNITPDSGLAPPTYRDPFVNPGDYPRAVGFFEQRRVFGGANSRPEKNEFSQVGSFKNFSSSSPIRDDDAISSTLTGNTINIIEHYHTENNLIVFCRDNEWLIKSSGTDKGFTVDTITQKPQGRNGIDRIRPISVSDIILFVPQGRGEVRSLAYSLEKDKHTGVDVNILSNHMLKDDRIFDWDWQKKPDSKVFMTTDKGFMLLFSFDTEQEMTAWTRAETGGCFESICTLRGGGRNGEDSTYVVVKRNIDGQTVRSVEVIREEYVRDVFDSCFLDAHISYSNEQIVTNITIDGQNEVIFTIVNHGLSDGNRILFRGEEGFVPSWDDNFNLEAPLGIVGKYYTITSATTDTFKVLDGEGNTLEATTLPVFRGGTLYAGKTASTFSGANHLNGILCDVVADGNVIRNVVPSVGSFTLDSDYAYVTIGLRYVMDVVLLPWVGPNGEVVGEEKIVPKVDYRVYRSLGGYIGMHGEPLYEILAEVENYDLSSNLYTRTDDIRISSTWDDEGKVRFVQPDPLPFNLLSVNPTVEIGDE